MNIIIPPLSPSPGPHLSPYFTQWVICGMNFLLHTSTNYRVLRLLFKCVSPPLCVRQCIRPIVCYLLTDNVWRTCLTVSFIVVKSHSVCCQMAECSWKSLYVVWHCSAAWKSVVSLKCVMLPAIPPLVGYLSLRLLYVYTFVEVTRYSWTRRTR